jgi:mRNA-degrading endonuclease RelE of RelBE toxin-antitoxin system
LEDTENHRAHLANAKYENLKDLIVEVRGQSVLLDSDVAELCGVETKRINEAVKNNPDKFPGGYIIELDKTEWDGLKSKFSTSIELNFAVLKFKHTIKKKKKMRNIFTRPARKELQSLPIDVAERLLKRIESLITNAGPAGCKKLSGSKDLWRLRVSSYPCVVVAFNRVSYNY